jgi:hypothetical protein
MYQEPMNSCPEPELSDMYIEYLQEKYGLIDSIIRIPDQEKISEDNYSYSGDELCLKFKNKSDELLFILKYLTDIPYVRQD